MRALVIYESMFGNTQVVAQEIATGLASQMSVETVEVGVAPTTLDPEIDLLVVGGPTHAFSMSRESTRKSAGDQATHRPLVSQGIGLREWLDAVSGLTAVGATATFDTKVRKPPLPGSAAKAAMKRLRHHGLPTMARPTSFYVGGTTGPLLSGESERARRWGEHLASELVRSDTARHSS